MIDRRRVRDWNVWATPSGDVVVDFYTDPSGWAPPDCGIVLPALSPGGALSLATQLRYAAQAQDKHP